MVDIKALIQLCVKNDRKAQKLLYEHFFSLMIPTCKRYLKNHEDALEVFNSSMLTVFTKIVGFKQEGSFEGWVRRIMVNNCLNFIRSNKNQAQLFSTSIESNTCEEVSVNNHVLESIDKAQLYHYLKDLSDSQQLVFNLYAIEGFSHKEISEKLKITAGTSRWYLSKARELLKDRIEKDGYVLLNTGI